MKKVFIILSVLMVGILSCKKDGTSSSSTSSTTSTTSTTSGTTSTTGTTGSSTKTCYLTSISSDYTKGDSSKLDFTYNTSNLVTKGVLSNVYTGARFLDMDYVYTGSKVTTINQFNYRTNKRSKFINYFSGTNSMPDSTESYAEGNGGGLVKLSTYIYKYNAQGLVSQLINNMTVSGYTIKYITDYTWNSDKNLIKEEMNSKIFGVDQKVSITEYSNYDNKPQVNSYVNIGQYYQPYTNSKNNFGTRKVTDVLSGKVSTYNLSYEYNSNNYVTKKTTSGSANKIETAVYNCK